MYQLLGSATLFSLLPDIHSSTDLPDPAACDFESAAIELAEDEHGCAVLCLGAHAATLSLPAAEALAAAPEATLRLATGERIAGRIEPGDNARALFRYAEPIDVVGVLARTLAALPADRRRMPRVAIWHKATLRCGDDTDFVLVRNISQRGVGIETSRPLAEADNVQLLLDALTPLSGTVRWVNGRHAGLALDDEIGWQTLMPWLRALPKHSQPAAPADGTEAGAIMPDLRAIRIDLPVRLRRGVQWWNARARSLTRNLVELETRAGCAPGTNLWVSLPGIGGGPANVIDAAPDRLLCAFRLPLPERAMGLARGHLSHD